MKEFIHDFFIFNEKILPCQDFNESYIFEGRSVYDAMRLIEGVPLFSELHYRRTVFTAGFAGLKIWLDETEVLDKIRQLSRANQAYSGNVKLVYNYRTDRNFSAYFVPYRYPTIHELEAGVKTHSFQGERDNPNAKLINKNLREATEKYKSDHHVYEVILVDRNGFITEGSRTNVFFIRGNKVYTTPLQEVLPGVTRSIIFEICRNEGIEITEEKISFEDCRDFDSFFISGTSPGILPVNSFNDFTYAVDHEIQKRIRIQFGKMIREYLSEKGIAYNS